MINTALLKPANVLIIGVMALAGVYFLNFALDRAGLTHYTL